MPATMSATAVDWVALSVPEFAAWARRVGVRLPFPLDAGELGFVSGPDANDMDKLLAERNLGDSPVLAAVAAVFAAPRLGVYAVRVTLDGAENRYAAFAGQDEAAVMVLVEPPQVAMRIVADTELAASVVGAVPQLPALHVPAAEISLQELIDIDAAIDAGASPRTLSAQMGQAGLPASLVALRQRVGNAPTPAGALGAVGFAGDTLTHSRRSATWREFEDGALLQVERGLRQGQARILLTAYTPDALFRAAVDAIGSVYETGGESTADAELGQVRQDGADGTLGVK